MNRDDAQALLETGAAKGHALALAAIVTRLRHAITDGSVGVLHDTLVTESERAAKLAAEYAARAEALLRDLEHPGARLARRVLFAARAARDAWRTAR